MNTPEQKDPAAAPLPVASPVSAGTTPPWPGSPESTPIPWETIAQSAEFKALLRRKAAFIVPACLFFVAYYFALPILVGFFPELMKTRIGSINLAYAFALSQFVMVWGLAALYVRVAARWDKQSAALVAHHCAVPK